jgi:HEAT repeat protein
MQGRRTPLAADERDTSPSGIKEEYALTTDPDARLQKLIHRLKSADYVKRIHAVLLLGRMGAGVRAAVPTLLELLQVESVQDRRLAAWTLGYLGQGAVEAIPALLVAVQDTNEGVRKMAREAVEKISPSGTQARSA